MRQVGGPPWRCPAAAARPALFLLLALGTALATAAARSTEDAAAPPPPLLRPTCLDQGHGLWVEQPASDPSLAPAELDYGSITLQHQGTPLAQLAASGLALGAAPAQWPVVDEALRSQCACCRLCSAQNDYSQSGAAVIRCKRWSFRSADGACRLFLPDRPGQRNVSLPGSGLPQQEQQTWFSGTAEQPRVLSPLYQPPQGAAPLQQCLVIATTGGGGLFAGGGGGGTSRGPPPPERPLPSPPARRPPTSQPPKRRPPHRSPPPIRSSPPLRSPPPARPPSKPGSPLPPPRPTPPGHRKLRPPPRRTK
ncbi:hypothetical protein ABPG75_011643 [Micractinium tetrahymenae]